MEKAHTLVSLLDEAVAKYRERTAVKSEISGENWTYEQLRENSLRVANALVKLGIGPGEMVARISDNTPISLAAGLGINRLGATDVPINEKLAPEDLYGAYFQLIVPKVVLVEGQYAEKVAQYTKSPIILTNQALTEQPKECNVAISPDDISTIIFSSGTTSESERAFKAVMLSHGNIVSNIEATRDLSSRAELIDGYPQGVYAAGLARQWHSFDHTVQRAFLDAGNLLHFTNERGILRRGHGTKINPHYMIMVPDRANLLMRRIKKGIQEKGLRVERVFEWFIKHSDEMNFQMLNNDNNPGCLERVLNFIGDKTFYKTIRTQLKEKVGENLLYLIGGSAKLPLYIQLFFYSIGVPIYQGYGLTETSPVICLNVPGAYKFESSGKTIPGVKSLIADAKALEEGKVEEVRIGKEGVILIKGPNVFKGYYKNPEATKKAFVGGWFNTGDLGKIDEEIFLYITGREKGGLRTLKGESPDIDREADYTNNERIERIVLVGDGLPRVGALVIPDSTTLSQLEAGLDESELIRSLCNNELSNTLETFGINLNTGNVAIVRDFDEQRFVTGTLKIRRNLIQSHYAGLVKKICDPKSG